MGGARHASLHTELPGIGILGELKIRHNVLPPSKQQQSKTKKAQVQATVYPPNSGHVGPKPLSFIQRVSFIGEFSSKRSFLGRVKQVLD